jgi:hypothetical protein
MNLNYGRNQRSISTDSVRELFTGYSQEMGGFIEDSWARQLISDQQIRRPKTGATSGCRRKIQRGRAGNSSFFVVIAPAAG